jgi:hypothetical protein
MRIQAAMLDSRIRVAAAMMLVVFSSLGVGHLAGAHPSAHSHIIRPS